MMSKGGSGQCSGDYSGRSTARVSNMCSILKRASSLLRPMILTLLYWMISSPHWDGHSLSMISLLFSLRAWKYVSVCSCISTAGLPSHSTSYIATWTVNLDIEEGGNLLRNRKAISHGPLQRCHVLSHRSHARSLGPFLLISLLQ